MKFKKAGRYRPLVYSKKTFDKIEIIQLATALTKKWNVNQKLNEQLNLLKKLQTGSSDPSSELMKSKSSMKSAMETLAQINEKLKKNKSS